MHVDQQVICIKTVLRMHQNTMEVRYIHTYSVKNNNPKTETCGTPFFKYLKDEISLFKRSRIACERFIKYELIQLRVEE